MIKALQLMAFCCSFSSMACFGALEHGAPDPKLPNVSSGASAIALPNGRELQFATNAPFSTKDLISMVYQAGDCVDCASRQNVEDGSEGGYCATLGAIKAGIAVFGIAGIFQSIVSSNDPAMTAVMRDARTLILTKDELEFAFKSDGRHGIVPGRCGLANCAMNRTADANILQDWITLYFAFAAKSLQTSQAAPTLCRQGIEGYRRAFDAIRNGFANQQSFALIGLQQYTFEDADLESTYGILWNPWHVMFYGHGMVDRWGTPQRKRALVFVKRVGLSREIQRHSSADSLTNGWDPFELGTEDRSSCAASQR